MPLRCCRCGRVPHRLSKLINKIKPLTEGGKGGAGRAGITVVWSWLFDILVWWWWWWPFFIPAAGVKFKFTFRTRSPFIKIVSKVKNVKKYFSSLSLSDQVSDSWTLGMELKSSDRSGLRKKARDMTRE